jgi:hypothetical protein
MPHNRCVLIGEEKNILFLPGFKPLSPSSYNVQLEVQGVYKVSLKFQIFFLQSLDFFLWGYVKDIVYRTKVRDITNLKQRTTDEGMLQRTWQETEYRFDVLRATNGVHTEVY